MKDRSQWTRGETATRTIKGKSYEKLTEFSRPCATCGKFFSIFVTAKIANGEADSNSFGLANCEDHRRSRKGTDSEQLATFKQTTNDELASLYARNKELFEELQVVKARLAQYELGPALEQHMARAAPNLTFPWQR